MKIRIRKECPSLSEICRERIKGKDKRRSIRGGDVLTLLISHALPLSLTGERSGNMERVEFDRKAKVNTPSRDLIRAIDKGN